MNTPARPPGRKTASTGKPSTGKQRSILGFFAKTPSQSQASQASQVSTQSRASEAQHEKHEKENALPCVPQAKAARNAMAVTPVPSSDPVAPSPSPTAHKQKSKTQKTHLQVPSPRRKAVNYAEESSDDDDVFAAPRARRARRILSDDEDEYAGVVEEEEDDDDDMADFVSDDEAETRKRKRPTKRADPRKRPTPSPTPRDDSDVDMDVDMNVDAPSTAQQWRFDPDNITPVRSVVRRAPEQNQKEKKEKAHTREPEERYTWLANPMDMDRRKPGDPDYDKGTIYVPPNAWHKFTPFERQYWEIKQKLYDTILFFKKGKFYELYENDATIGHQLFDFKMTDRVNMRMVGVPEGSLDIWVNQFISKGFKVARVDQMESALGKEMREREREATKTKAKDKIIRRELACVLTRGTLVDGGMLQDDMATFCAAVKQGTTDDGRPVFGVAFVDAATGQFFVSEFVDDANLTRFETFVAQTAPQELILEKGHVSTKAMRILKNNTTPMTLWNLRRPGTEFWDAVTTQRTLEAEQYFSAWPAALDPAKTHVLSAFGALVSYLQALKLERSLLTQGNIAWYDPIQRDGTLVLDGQTLTNLEVFANTSGGPEGTLFALLNRATTPFGKRLLRQWVAHPLCNMARLQERHDAVAYLLQNGGVRDLFVSEMSKMPDLERLGSRIHAGACRADDFVRVLEGFEHIEYTFGVLKEKVGDGGLVGRLVGGLPDLGAPLGYWKDAFDRRRARDDKLMVPTRGVDDDYDQCVDEIARIKHELDALLARKAAELKARLKFTDVGKEVYQIEAPKATKVPSSWRQMSATSAVRRFYFGELEDLVRALQEAEETCAQRVRDVALRLCRRFDADADTWLATIRTVAQLDCLVSLATASAALGQPACRPVFVDEPRSVVEFASLRHPCMAGAVDDFIPNDVVLGGASPNMSLLTGANAAGKSTVLRMTCIAVIMAQVGCLVPAASARLTPVDRIMSRLGANDNIFAAQSTFFVELAETKKILAEATPRSLVILDELGRGTSSYDGVAVAQAVLHHVASHIGCVGFFATHYHSLAAEFAHHPEVRARRMQIHVDDARRKVTFAYRLEDGVAEGSFGMHCASMCGIPDKVVAHAEDAARAWEHTSRLKDSLDQARAGCYIPLGLLSDVAALLRDDDLPQRGVDVLLQAIAAL